MPRLRPSPRRVSPGVRFVGSPRRLPPARYAGTLPQTFAAAQSGGLMAVEVVMPRLSDSMEEGTVLEWHAAEGETVRRGQPLVEIETDKATITYEAEADGVLLEILVAPGDAAPLGAPIARIGAAGDVPARTGNGRSAASPRVAASPLARRLARELGVDL